MGKYFACCVGRGHIYLVSIVYNATVVCVRDVQGIWNPLIINTYPVVNVRSMRLDPKSASPLIQSVLACGLGSVCCDSFDCLHCAVVPPVLDQNGMVDTDLRIRRATLR